MGGAAGGAAVGAWFAGVGAAISGPLGGFGAGIVYSFGISSEVQEAAGEFWDNNIGFGNQMAGNIPQMSVSFDPETSEIQFISEMQVEATITAQAFDPEFYLSHYPDAAEAVANGDVPSAYVHFLTVGAEAGYLPSAGADPVDPADLVGNDDPDLQRLSDADSHWGIYQTPQIGDINGGGLSAPEQAFFDAIVAERTEDVTFELDAAMTALANRRAVDLVHNQGFDPAFLEAIGGERWGSGTWANGQAFVDGARDMLTEIDSFELNDSRVYAFTSEAGTPEELLSELSSSLLGRQVLYDTAHRSVGIAEYGGVWVIVTSTDFADGPPADEVNDSVITRLGSQQGETMALGTWRGDLSGFGGRDNLAGGTQDDTITGGGADDNLTGNGGADIVLGNNGNDQLNGDAGNDSLAGGIGFDTMQGGDDDDRLTGSDGYDELHGGQGNDDLRGNNGFDQLYGDGGDDALFGGLSPDTMYGGDGNDYLIGQSGGDMLYGEAGNDRLEGNAGADTMEGGDGRDYLDGGINFDQMEGGGGTDTMTGGNGADTILGGASGDILQGNAGADRMDGGEGSDVMRGGIGADTFVFNGGDDVVIDFSNNIDNLEISASLLTETEPAVADLVGYADVVDGDLVLDFGNGDTLTLNNVTVVNSILDDTLLV
jgi:Ca2+-binding RTX toxin-like protein